MVIQTHAENALKHGLIPKESPGKISITIHSEGDYLMIAVEDNGIGRKQSKVFKTSSTSKGLRIMEQFFDMYNRYNKPPIRQVIIDLYDSTQQPAGTRVIIAVPGNFNRNVVTTDTIKH